MVSQTELDLQFRNDEMETRIAKLERQLGSLWNAGLDRLAESGYVQFDGIGMRWDNTGMQVESASEAAAVHFVGSLSLDPGAEATRAVLAGEIDTIDTAASVYLRAYGDTFKSAALSVTANAQDDVYSTKIIDGWFGIATVVSPSTITTTQDNYNPTNLQYAGVLRLASDASRDITGIAGGAAGRILLVLNVGSFDIVLKDDTTSTAANRFQLNGDVTLAADEGAFLWYDATSSRWRMAGKYSAGGGAGDVSTDVLWDALGDLAVGTGANTANNLPVGTDGYVLTADSTDLSFGIKWAPAAGGPGGSTSIARTLMLMGA